MHLDMPIVETKRLLLRPIHEDDANDLFACYADPLVTRYLTFTAHQNVEQTKQVLRVCYLPYIRMGQPQTWSMIWKEEHTVIGVIGFHTMEDDHAQVGYMLQQKYWNLGIMKEAMQALLNVGFMYTGLRRIEALYEKEHMASEKLLKSCGFHIEGCLRQHTKLGDGEYHDMHIAAILKNDWKEHSYENIRYKI